MSNNKISNKIDDIYENNQKIIYTINKQGQIKSTTGTGCDAEINALKEAIKEIEYNTKIALEQVKLSKISILAYHMHHQRLDVTMLAQATGQFKWQVKRHFKPNIFKRLPLKILRKYAVALDIDVNTLQNISDLPD
ncbi:MAG: hypothetical protein DSY43_03120 [Gammaproteobacteria bacterium]|uniref:HTH cro/C1-type domain-containing protein n=1 Tax=endosymbiont of Bathymodiolus septemdierum str. Myojin knoll TaxID=1303921 RepID=A0A0P0UTA8_9GAMM|nr:hypothetical protein [Bathymodiolus septemdierum thioautotrophic gill symbiont]RUA06015.1 MAG: hypothetical protein DSY43_03120 [Gammaproteobacteria bacterium]BAS68337.1 conserved hypothetical protein [endosymbiont of Bathymodiolus septemdierum str. Myojin knoll]